MLNFWNFIILSCVALLLTGCVESAKIKQEAQKQYDEHNPNGDSGFCLYVGSLRSYPYTTTNNPEPIPNGLHIERNQILNKRLQIYSQIGLFTQEQLRDEEEQSIYRYSLTPLGQQYLYQFTEREAFCFGKIIIDDVVIDSASDDNWGRSTKWFNFKFHIENIPQWVSSNYVQLNQTYRFDVKKMVNNGYQPMAGRLISTPEGWAMDASYSRMLRGSY